MVRLIGELTDSHIEKNQIIIKKNNKKRQHKTLAERLIGFEGDYTGAECDTGAPVGKEIVKENE